MTFTVSLFKSLRIRLVFMFLLVQLAALGFLWINTQQTWVETIRRSTFTRVQSLTELFGATLTMPRFDDGGEANIAKMMEQFIGLPDMRYVMLYDNQDHLIATRGHLPDILPPVTVFSEVEIAERLPPIVHVSVPIVINDKYYGRLRYGLSTERANNVAKQATRKTLGLVAIGALISTLLILLLSHWLTRRLYQLMHVADLNTNADQLHLANISGADEIAKLAAHFNALVQAEQGRREALEQSEERLLAIANYAHNIEFWLGPEGQLLWVNPSVVKLTGYSIESCLQMANFPVPLAVPADAEAVRNVVAEMLSQRTQGQEFEFQVQVYEGTTWWASMAWQPIYNSKNTYLGLRASIHDHSQSKKDRLVLRQTLTQIEEVQAQSRVYLSNVESERARLNSLLSAIRLGVLFVENDSTVVYYNPTMKKLWGIDDTESLLGKPITDFFTKCHNRPEDMHISDHDRRREHALMYDALPTDLIMRDGCIVTQRYYTVQDADGLFSGMVWLYEDVTKEHARNERMAFLAERDALTGLYNRHAFQDRIAAMLLEAQAANSTLAVFYFDLDEFKYVNDTYGHGTGDNLLKQVAHTVSEKIRHSELFARLGGDEFAILVPGCTEEEVNGLAARIVTMVSGVHFVADSHDIRVTASVGVALYPKHADNPEDLVTYADMAMYQSKEAGKNTWRMYEIEQDTTHEMLTRLAWNESIQNALENNGFVLYFQGIYSVATGEVAHLEALIRMKDPSDENKVIFPGQFIPIAEKTGRILDIDRWVIRESIRLLSENSRMPSVAVNISGRSFDQPSLPDYISDLLHEYHVLPSRFMVELTETAAISEMRDAQRFIEALHNMGCTVCLDDFGSGFSSFAYLKNLAVEVLKIDGQFVKELTADRDSQVFVRGITSIAHSLDKHTVAEFVENGDILRMLAEFGVNMVQGYHLDKPTRDHPAISGQIDLLKSVIQAATEGISLVDENHLVRAKTSTPKPNNRRRGTKTHGSKYLALSAKSKLPKT